MKKKFNSKRIVNMHVFDDTVNLVKIDSDLRDAVALSSQNQSVILESDDVKIEAKHRFSKPAIVFVSNSRSLEAVKKWYGGTKVCVHNFASAINPGGGVLTGATAQEEAICRCSTLYFNISEPDVVNKFHNAHKKKLQEGTLDVKYNDDCIFTPDVIVFKSDTENPTILDKKEWYKADIITCAAPNLRNKPSNSTNSDSVTTSIVITDEELLQLHIKRMTRILSIAKQKKEDVMILGAFGCGAFYNSPKVVAKAMKIVVEKFKYDFKVIEFAVFCTPKDMQNYEEFKKVFP